MPKLPALPFVRSGVSAGLSANQAFRQYQQAAEQAEFETGEPWTASRRTVFLQVYSDIRAQRGQVPDALVAPADVPGGSLPELEQATVRTSGYVNWTASFVRQVGTAEVETWVHYQKSSSPLTPEQASELTRADIEASMTEAHGSAFGMVIEGIAYTGYAKLVPTPGL